jgi:hypothetical protein
MVKDGRAKDGRKVEIVRAESPMEFFKGQVEEAMEHQRLKASEESAYYLVQLLDAYVRPDRLYRRAEVPPDRALAEVFCTALAADGFRRFALFRLSGDMSLLLSGFFSDSLHRKSVDVDYYIRLGGTAYSTAAVSCDTVTSAQLFEELAANFARFVDVLNEVSGNCSLTDDTNLLRLYERFVRTGSPRCAELLRRHGVDAVPGSMDVVH